MFTYLTLAISTVKRYFTKYEEAEEKHIRAISNQLISPPLSAAPCAEAKYYTYRLRLCYFLHGCSHTMS